MIKKINDKTLASAYKSITAAQDGIGDKTYDTDLVTDYVNNYFQLLPMLSFHSPIKY